MLSGSEGTYPLEAAPEAESGASRFDEGEQHRVLVEWNQTSRSYAGVPLLHRRIESQVDAAPDAVALSFEGETLTYRELNRRANRLARQLRDLGVGPDMPVAVAMERSFEMVVGLLAVLKAGGAYLPLEPTDPRSRLQTMLDDAGVRVVLARAHGMEALAGPARHLVVVPEGGPGSDGQADGNLSTDVAPENAAYVIFTSGSTGRPKGVMNTHEGIVNRLDWMQEAYGLTAEDRVLQKTPFTFDVSVWEFFWPLLRGAQLVVARPGGHQQADYLARLVGQEGVTTIHFVPSMLQVFLDQPELSWCRSLKRVICSGESLPHALAQRFFSSRLTAELHNLYGPTEASVDVTAWRCRPDDRAPVPIGRPIANTRMYVLDGSLRPVPPGVVGELFIAGIGLARGYVGRPDLTAERFLPHPYGTSPGERLYRTGDRARYREDGVLEVLGRIDHQVKIRGFRIELSEIEAVLSEHPGVREAVASVVEGADGDRRLAAYFVAGSAPGPASGELKGFLQERLPEYMVPAAIVPLDALPLLPNGKVDRRGLPAPDFALASAAYAAPESSTEETLAGIWSEVLGVPRVGIHDNFFELGGHSLLMAQVASRVREVLGVEVPMWSFFIMPTVAGLATTVTELRASQQGADVMNQVLDGLEHMSEDELVRLLDAQNQGQGEGA